MHLIKMNDQEKVELFDELLACAMQSSHAIDATVRALAPDPIHAAQAVESLDSNKVILSKVLIRPLN
jgi:hypothetical protein